jgi:hypothetical protein
MAVWNMPLKENLNKIFAFRYARSRQSRENSVSEPIIHEKWKCSRDARTSKTGDMARLKKRYEELKSLSPRLCLGLRAVQLILTYLLCSRCDLSQDSHCCALGTKFGRFHGNRRDPAE